MIHAVTSDKRQVDKLAYKLDILIIETEYNIEVCEVAWSYLKIDKKNWRWPNGWRCLKDIGITGLAPAWTMARRKPKEYRCQVDAATRCSGVCCQTWLDMTNVGRWKSGKNFLSIIVSPFGRCDLIASRAFSGSSACVDPPSYPHATVPRRHCQSSTENHKRKTRSIE